MTVSGRVVYGMEPMQRIKRAPDGSGGIFENTENTTHILSITLSSNIPVEKRPLVYVEITEGDAFTKQLRHRKHRDHPLFL